jgi:hypothetical protein
MRKGLAGEAQEDFLEAVMPVLRRGKRDSLRTGVAERR